MNKKITLILFVLFTIVLNANAQIAAWQLNGALGNEVTKTATVSDANISVPILSRNGGIVASALANAFSSTTFPASGTQVDATTNGRGYYFSFSANAGYQASLSTLDYRIRRSSTGPNSFIWQYSTNGTTFTDIGAAVSYTATTTGGDAQTQLNLSSITALQNVASGTTITFRLLCWGASAATGTAAIGRSLTTGTTDYSLNLGGTVSLIPTPPTASVLSATSTSLCLGSSTNLSVAITGGTSPYTIVYSDGTTSTTVTSYVSGTNIPLTPSSTKTYSLVSVTDASSLLSTGLSGTPTVTVNAAPTFSSFTSTNSLCFGANDGSISVSSLAPSPVFTISPTATQSPLGTFASLSSQTYTVTVTDGNSCTASSTATITSPTALTASIATSGILCNGGLATLNGSATGGSSGYTYKWLDGTSNTATVVISPSKDNTIFEENQSNSNGAGPYMVAGNNGFGYKGRALLAFDIATNIPSGATINSASLFLNCSQTNGAAGAQIQSLHKLLQNWGEGTSFSTSAGAGTVASTNDATWLTSFYPGTSWTTSGGTFTSTASASQTVNTVGGYTWTSAGLVSDVQNWLNSSSTNFGWLLKGAETASTQAKRFDSKENSTVANRPTLTVNYTAPTVLATTSTLSNVSAGTYTLVVTDANGCTSSSVVTITNPTALTVTATVSNASICLGQSTTFIGTSSNAVSYSWSNGTNTPTNNVAFTPSTSGTSTYNVIAVDANGCTATSTVSLTVNALPTIVANTTASSICNGSSVTLSGSGATSYVWDNSVLDNVAFNPTSTLTYVVTGTDANSCSNTSSVQIIVNSNPIISASITPTSVCTGTIATATATSSAPIVWNNGIIDNTPFVATASNLYTATATDGNGCTATSTVSLTVNSLGTNLVNATSNSTVNQIDGSTINYTNSSCDLIATINDGSNGNILGSTTSYVTVLSTAANYNGQPFVRRWYEITPTTNGPATITLYLTQADFDDYNLNNGSFPDLPTTGSNTDPNISNIRITKISGGILGTGTPTVITPSMNWNGNYWEATFPVTSFSQFYFHSVNPNNVPLPTTITNFKGEKNGTTNQLTWNTVNEINNAYFNVLYSTDGKNFSSIGNVNTLSQNGNSNAELAYSFTHTTPQLGNNFYKLEQVDLDGKTTINSTIIDVLRTTNGSTFSIYPNPMNDVVNVRIYSTNNTKSTIKLLDMSGRIVKEASATNSVGNNNISMNVADLSTGIYFVQIIENGKLISTSKIRK